MTNQTNPTFTKINEAEKLLKEWSGEITWPKAELQAAPSSEPVARLAFVAAIQSTVTDLVQQYELIRMYDTAHPTPTLSAAELGQILEALKSGLCGAYPSEFARSSPDPVTRIRAAITLLEKVKP